MQYIQVENSQIPVLGLGTYKLTGEVVEPIVHEALDIGYRHIDTAQFYDNEAEIGQALKNASVSREEIFLTTKVWHTNLDQHTLMPSVNASLSKLQSDYVDLLLIHWPSPFIPLSETLKALLEVKKSGKAKHIGVSNFTIQWLQGTLDVTDEIICNQVEYHPLLDQSKVRAYMKHAGLFLTAYCPLAKGNIVDHPLLADIGKKYGKSAGQVSLRWLIQHGDVVAIPKTSKKARLKENLDVFDFELSEDEFAQIANLGSASGRQINPMFAPNWDV